MSVHPATVLDFDVQSAPLGVAPQVLAADSLMIEHSEWLHMTFGPFFSRVGQTSSGAIQYLLDGPEYGSAPDAAAELIEKEVAAFERAIRRIDEALSLVGDHARDDPTVSLTAYLLSLRMLLDVNLPDPTNADAVHLRADRLLLSRWGLTWGSPVRAVLLQLKTSSPKGYTRVLRQTLENKYRSGSIANNGLKPERQTPGGATPTPDLAFRMRRFVAGDKPDKYKRMQPIDEPHAESSQYASGRIGVLKLGFLIANILIAAAFGYLIGRGHAAAGALPTLLWAVPVVALVGYIAAASLGFHWGRGSRHTGIRESKRRHTQGRTSR